jgi:hypothetical protein
MKTTRVPLGACATCGHKLDSATSIGANVPSEGSVSICVGCGALSIFTADLTLRPPTPKEMREISLYPAVVEAQIMIRGTQMKEAK